MNARVQQYSERLPVRQGSSLRRIALEEEERDQRPVGCGSWDRQGTSDTGISRSLMTVECDEVYDKVDVL